MKSTRTILLIEDEPAMVLGISDALAFEGYRVLSASTGREGMALAREETPDLVVLDLMLPPTQRPARARSGDQPGYPRQLFSALVTASGLSSCFAGRPRGMASLARARR